MCALTEWNIYIHNHEAHIHAKWKCHFWSPRMNTRHIHEAVWTACCSGFYLSPRSIIRMKQCTRHSFGSKYLKLHSLKVTREFTVHVTLIDKIRLCDHCTLCWKVDGSWKVKSTLSSFSTIIHICGGRREQNVDIYERCGVKPVKHHVAWASEASSSNGPLLSIKRKRCQKHGER